MGLSRAELDASDVRVEVWAAVRGSLRRMMERGRDWSEDRACRVSDTSFAILNWLNVQFID